MKCDTNKTNKSKQSYKYKEIIKTNFEGYVTGLFFKAKKFGYTDEEAEDIAYYAILHICTQIKQSEKSNKLEENFKELKSKIKKDQKYRNQKLTSEWFIKKCLFNISFKYGRHQVERKQKANREEIDHMIKKEDRIKDIIETNVNPCKEGVKNLNSKIYAINKIEKDYFETIDIEEAINTQLNQIEIYVVKSFYFNRYRIKEIARQANRSENAVKMILHRARKKLALYFKQKIKNKI